MPSCSIYLETFGCQMNELDSELVAGQLRALGYRFTPDAAAADVVLYNTCSVREHAEQKVWSRLGELKERKARQPRLVVGVLGCLAERDGVDLIRRMPVVDILCGPGELDKLPRLLDNAVRTRGALEGEEERDRGTEGQSDRGEEGEVPSAECRVPSASVVTPYSALGTRDSGLTSARQVALQGSTSRRSGTLAAAADSLEMLDLSRAISPVDEGPRRRSAYVRITRGCNKFCTYCVVPFTRGAEVHRPPDHIVEECRRLADAGVIEVTLLGQTVNHYRFEHGAAVTVNGIVQPQKGRSYKGGHRRDPFKSESTTTFADLLARIHEEVPAIRRLRFVTSYPRDFGDDVLEVIRDHPRICRYLHVPAQSGSNRILGLMNRGYTVEEYLEFLERARGHLDQPEKGRPLTIAGDVIVGFPTESEEDVEATRALLRKARYKNCFIFKYSARPGTVAHEKMPDDVPDEVKRKRNNELLALQNEISAAEGRGYVGRTVEVMVEGLSQREVKKRKAGRPPHSSHSHAHNGSNGMVGLTVGGRSVLGHAGAPSACEMPPLSEDEEMVSAAEAGAAVQVTGRTDGDLIVHVDVPTEREAEEMTGRIVRVRVTGSSALSLVGEVV
jgi:tRNA-2-methylthio-N6-dimethylallyladenosine synthase